MLSGINIFISYAHRDGVTLATQLHGDLAKRGHNPWLDQRRLIGGSNWSREIENALDTADVVLALFSVGSFESEVCRGEQLRSLRHHKCLIPLLVQSDVDRPIYIEARQFIDFSEPTLYTLRLDDLIHAIDHRSGAILNVVYRTTAYDTVPPLPANFVPRSVELESLRSLVLNDHQKQDVELIAVQGLGG